MDVTPGMQCQGCGARDAVPVMACPSHVRGFPAWTPHVSATGFGDTQPVPAGSRGAAGDDGRWCLFYGQSSGNPESSGSEGRRG